MTETTRVVRHRLVDRLYHWLMAAAMLTLLLTSFLPILGVKFAWVDIHWISGVILIGLVLFHILRAVFVLRLRDMWVGPREFIAGQKQRDQLAHERHMANDHHIVFVCGKLVFNDCDVIVRRQAVAFDFFHSYLYYLREDFRGLGCAGFLTMP